ncbi:hypothetical protein [Nocardioides fonticola]
MTIRWLTLVPLLCVSLASCGSDDEGAGAADAEATSASEAGPACTTALTATYPDGTSVELNTTTAAVELGDGTGYTLYATDYDLSTTDIGTATVRPGAGQHLASVFIAPVSQDGATAIESGANVPAGQPTGDLSLGVILYSGEDDFGVASAPAGSVTFDEIGESGMCASIDYTDDEKSLQGTFAAEIFDSPF